MMSHPVSPKLTSKVALFFMSLCCAALVACHRGPAPQPPEINLDGMEAPVADLIGAALAEAGDNPWAAEVWGKLGTILLAHGQYENAVTVLRQAEALDDSDARWPYLRAVCLERTEREAAIQALSNAIGNARDETIPRLRLGEVLQELGRGDEAVEQFEWVLERDAINPRAHFGMGAILFSQGDLPAARRHLEASLKEAGDVRAAHALLITVCFRLQDKDRATFHKTEAVRIGVDYPWPDPFLYEVAKYEHGSRAFQRRANNLLRLRRFDEAIALLDRALELYPESSAFLTARALGRNELGKRDAALEDLRMASSRSPDNPTPHYFTGLILAKAGDSAEAERAFRQAIAVESNHVESWFELGKLMARKRRLAEAEGAFGEVIALKPSFPEVFKLQGIVLIEQGRWEEAAPMLERYLRLNPEDTPMRRLLADTKQKSTTR
jgi:tetratricopeptide (TPR) repeat protein